MKPHVATGLVNRIFTSQASELTLRSLQSAQANEEGSKLTTHHSSSCIFTSTLSDVGIRCPRKEPCGIPVESPNPSKMFPITVWPKAQWLPKFMTILSYLILSVCRIMFLVFLLQIIFFQFDSG